MPLTRPTGDQIRFQSQYTGEHILDAYMEAAEVGGRQLGVLLRDVFDTNTGLVRNDLVEFRLSASRELETRTAGGLWAGSGAFISRVRGNWTASTAYEASDYVTISGAVYICSTSHTSGVSPDLSKFTDLLGSVNLSAIAAAGTPAADKVPYYTSGSAAGLADFTAVGRSVVGAASQSAARTALGLTTLAITSTAAVPSLTLASGATLTLDADPASALHAATKQYVDAQVATRQAALGFTPLNKAGDSMNSFLTLHADPSSALHAATKQYVDNSLSSKLSLSGGIMSGGITMLGVQYVNGAAGTDRGFWFRTANSHRFGFALTPEAETGSNAGSNLALYTYTDAGAFTGTVMTVYRSTMGVAFAGPVSAAGGFSGNASSASALGATRLNQSGAQTAYAAISVAADWQNLPSGFGGFMNGSIGTAGGAPVDNYGYFFKTGIRDVAGGWAGLWLGYSAKQHYIGQTSVGSSFASWERILTVGSDNNLIFDNCGIGIVGVYDAARFQKVFSMGAPYTMPADGTTPGNMYGLVWSHTNAGGQTKAGLSHQLLIMHNGETQSAIGVGIWTKGNIALATANAEIVFPESKSIGHWAGTYGAVVVYGSTNGYGGVYVHTGTTYLMFDAAGNGGLYNGTGGQWHSYFNIGNNCIGIGGATTTAGYRLQVNGGLYVTGALYIERGQLAPGGYASRSTLTYGTPPNDHQTILLTHGNVVRPTIYHWHLRCVTAVQGYAVGDCVILAVSNATQDLNFFANDSAVGLILERTGAWVINSRSTPSLSFAITPAHWVLEAVCVWL